MAEIETETYSTFPLYHQALKDLQAGKWEEGLNGLAEVEKRFPLDTDLRALRLEMQLRSRIDDYEVEEEKARKARRFRQAAFRVTLVFLVIALMFTAITTYSGWLGKQWNTAQQAFNSQVRQTELAVLFLNANELLKAGQTAEALQILQEISQSEPDYPGLSDVMNTALAQQELEAQYTQAMEMLAAGNAQDALTLLQMIDQQAPQFRDVSLQIQSLETQTQLDTYLAQADQAFAEGRWDYAIAGYESLRLLEPDYRTSYIEDRLFQAYINAATALLEEPLPSLQTLREADNYFSLALSLRPQDREVISARTTVRNTIEDQMIADFIDAAQNALVDNADSLEALAIAETYFARALELRPNDPNVLLQYQLARSYLDAIESFAARDYDAVIEALEYVVGLDPDYASGTARQTLFEAYIGRGQAALIVGDYELAIRDFQSAATLAEQVGDVLTIYLEAQIMIAEAEGMAGNYLRAIQIYQNALYETGLRDMIINDGGPLADDLQSAEVTALAGNYPAAFELYRAVLRSRFSAYDTSTVVTVKSGDYITSIAREFGTTVSAILAANDLTNEDRLDPDTELIIPTLP